MWGDYANLTLAASTVAAGSWTDRIADVLTHPVIVAALLLIAIVSLALELLFFGTGLWALASVGGFGLYFLGAYLAGTAGFQEVTLFVVGIVLLLLEVFVPSFGLLGVLGSLGLLSGVMMAGENPQQTMWLLGVAFLLALLVVGVAFKYWKHRGVWHRFILREQLTTEQGFVSNPNKHYLQGRQGKALTPLRPAGTALLAGERVDVVTEGGFIESGKTVSVIQVDGTRVVVKEVDVD